MTETNIIKPKRNFYISYLKGWAILSVILIHLIDWSNTVLTTNQTYWKELFYPGVFFFIATVGSVIYIAYGHYPDLKKPFRRLLTRGFQLLGVYYLYNIIKFFVFDFSKQPYYGQFIEKGTFDLKHILLLQSASVPITIIVTIGLFLLIGPLLLWLVKKVNFPKLVILGLIIIMIGLNYFVTLPENIVTNLLLSKNLVYFPPLLWSLPFLIGFYLALYGLGKKMGWWFLFWSVLAGGYAWYLITSGQSWRPSWYMYPLRPYYIIFSLALMYGIFCLGWLFEKIKSKWVNLGLATLRVLGDSTLGLYIYHWIIIDLTIWLFAPQYKSIWWTVSGFLVIFLIFKRKQIKLYWLEHNENLN